MSKWQNIRLGDIADFSNGINFDKSSYCENGTYLIGVSDFGEELFPDYSTLRPLMSLGSRSTAGGGSFSYGGNDLGIYFDGKEVTFDSKK